MKQLQALLCLALLALAGCGGPKPEATVEPVALVSLATAVTADMPVLIRGYGNVEFDPSSKRILNAEIEARVLELLARAGDVVAQGQVIVRLVPSTAGDIEVSRARRDATNAQAAAERTRRLRADGLASDADVEAANNAARDLAEQAASLEARTGAILTLRAPVSGVVDGLLAEPGDLIAPGTPIVRLASPDAVRARIGIEVEDAANIPLGAPVKLQSLDNSHIAVATTISLVDTRIDPATRMAGALAAIPTGAGLLAGEAVRAEITAGTRAAAVIVPRAAVFEDETGSYVFLAHNGSAQLKRVETGLTNGDNTQILAGIAAGDSIIVEGAATLADGMKIRTAEVPAHE